MADQQQLFDPGSKGPNQWTLHPDKWINRPDVVYHATDQPALPRHDRGPNIDPGYGNSTGMHFGNKDTAFERSRTAMGTLDYIHTARLNREQFTPKDAGLAANDKQRAKDNAWTDEAANYAHKPDKAVREGKVVPYINEYENRGATSYRAKPEATKTWSEDVKDDPNAHPALKHLADRGYNPTMGKYENYSPMEDLQTRLHGPAAKQLFEGDVEKNGKSVAHHVALEDAIAESGDRKMVNKETGVSFKRNNVAIVPGSIERQRSAVPRLRPTRKS